MGVLFRSDLVEFVASADSCMQRIDYTDDKDFDGLYFADGSPAPNFYILVEAVFNQEQNPQEQEDLELSNGKIVTLRQSIQEKRLLELGYLPNYMHKKIQKVLMMQTVEIEDETWRKRDSYEDQPVKKYSLKKAQVWLTKYDSVQKNTI